MDVVDDDCLLEEEETFQQAADYLAAHTSSLSQSDLLKLYGLYKQAIVGPCTTQKPAFWDVQARSKWNAWRNLGDLPKQDAMCSYVAHLSRVLPEWQPQQRKGGKKRSTGMGPVFSTMAAAAGEDEPGMGGEQGPGNEHNQLHAFAGAGDVQGVQSLLDAGVDVDQPDNQNCTPLHFAADRGCLATAQQLLNAGAQVNAQDDDGQTPLHYAALCGNRQVALMLKDEAGADVRITDSSGKTASSYAPSGWAELLER